MSATMARQGGRVHLEQSDMRLALNMAKMAKGGFSRATIEETEFLVKKPWAAVREEKEPGVAFRGHNDVNAVMERHPAMPQGHLTDGCLCFQNGSAQNPQTRCRRKGTGAPQPMRLRQPTREPTPHSPETPPVPACNNLGAHVYDNEGVLPGYVYIHTHLPSAQFSNLNAYAKDRKRDEDFNPDLLRDEGTSTG